MNKVNLYSRSQGAFVGLCIEVLLSIAIILTDDFNVCSYITVIQTMIAVLTLAGCGYGIVSIPVFFVIFTYIFHCSQFIFYTLGIEYNVAFDIVKMVGEELSRTLMKYFVLSIMFLTIGFMIRSGRKSDKRGKLELSNAMCSYIGKCIMAICFIPRIYSDFSNVVAYLKNGYEATYSGESGLMLVWAYGFYLGLMFYIVGNRERSKYIFRVLIIFICYLLIMMVSGRRLEQAGVLISLLIIYIRYCRKGQLKISKLIGFAIVGYVSLAVIATMGDMRYSLSFSFDAYFNTFLNNLKGKMLTGQLAEFGDTGVSLAYAIKSFPEYHPFHYGLTYVFAWIQVIPNVGGFIQRFFETDINFTAAIPDIFRSNFGCTYLGELYYNFGYLGAVANIVIGYIVGKICIFIDDAAKDKFTIKSLIYIGIIPLIFTYIRGSFGDFARIFVYYGILLRILSKLSYVRSDVYPKFVSQNHLFESD